MLAMDFRGCQSINKKRDRFEHESYGHVDNSASEKAKRPVYPNVGVDLVPCFCRRAPPRPTLLLMRAAKGDGSIFRSGAGFRGYVTVNGRRKYFRGKTKAEAAQVKRELLQRLEQGRLAAGRSLSVAAWLRYWLDEIADPRATTAQTNRYAIEKKIIPALGQKSLESLAVEDVEQWLNSMQVKPSTKARYLAPLNTALVVAVKRGKVGYNVIDRLESKPKPPGRKQARRTITVLSSEDRAKVLAVGGRNSARWELALKLGLRPGEALGLSWSDFDEVNSTLTIRNQLLRATGVGLYLQPEPKTDAGERVIRLPRSISCKLIEHRSAQRIEREEMGAGWVGWSFKGKLVPLIFTQRNGRPIDARMDTAHWKDLLSAAGVPPTNRYASRHTAASHMVLASGGDVAVVAHVLGHADPAFTYGRYVHALTEREGALMDQLDLEDAPYAAPYAPELGEPAQP